MAAALISGNGRGVEVITPNRVAGRAARKAEPRLGAPRQHHHRPMHQPRHRRGRRCASCVRKRSPRARFEVANPVSASYRTSLRHVKAEIGKLRAETDPAKPQVRAGNPENPSLETGRLWPKPRKCRRFPHASQLQCGSLAACGGRAAARADAAHRRAALGAAGTVVRPFVDELFRVGESGGHVPTLCNWT